MLLTRVDVSEDAYRCMLSHALTSEHEEVMGLLAGDTAYGPDCELVCTVWSVAPQSRSDRRRDRVRLSCCAPFGAELTRPAGRLKRRPSSLPPPLKTQSAPVLPQA
jgi:hypothetical protein